MRAIDIHVHPSTRGLDLDAFRYFKRNSLDLPKSEREFATLYSRNNVKALLLAWHPSTVKEGARVTNQYALDLASQFPESFAGILASFDMDNGSSEERIRQAEEHLKNQLVKGFKFHPPDQGFSANDRKFYCLWEILEASQKPVMFHVGFTVLGASFPGGKGIALDHGRPIHLDTLARDFPKMKIIAAHPGWPWQEELIGILTHKKNILVDTSGYLAEQLPETFLRAIGGRLQDKALFGTDFPYVSLEKALESFAKLPFQDAVKEKILITNARREFGV